MAYILMALDGYGLCSYGPIWLWTIKIWPYMVMPLYSYGPIELWPDIVMALHSYGPI